MVSALRRAAIAVRVASVTTASGARRAIDQTRPAVVIVDSIAFARAVAAIETRDARVIALVHMPVGGGAARAVLRRADRVVSSGPALRGPLRALGAERVTVIEPGADGVPIRARIASRARALRVLCVANWSRVKGIDVLLAATRAMHDVRVVIAGDGVPRSRAARAVGSVGRARLAALYADADVVVVPSRSEGYGIAAAEALAHGLPVIASDIPALRMTLGHAARYVRPADPRALARAIEDMRDPRRRARLATAARRRALRLPRWRDTERAFVALVDAELQRYESGGDGMPPRGVKSKKRTRQYEHIKQSEMKRGRSAKTAKRIAAATTNKTRRKKGETKSSRGRKKS